MVRRLARRITWQGASGAGLTAALALVFVPWGGPAVALPFAQEPAPSVRAPLVWEEDSFDTLFLGPLDAQNGWFRASPERASPRVVDDGSGGGMLEIDAEPGTTIVMVKDVPDQLDGRHRFSFRVRVRDATLPSLAKIEIKSTPDQGWDKKLQLYFGSSMRINYGPLGQAALVVTRVEMELDRWYEIDMLLHLEREQVDVRVDGALVVHDLPMHPGPLTALGLSGWERPGVVELDDLLGQRLDDGGAPGCGAHAATERVSVSSSGEEADGNSRDPSISADGRWVAFSSRATNLVPGDDLLGRSDIFVYDRDTCTVRKVSVGEDGAGNLPSQRPSISADGQIVAFDSLASNFLLDDDLQFIDTNGVLDVYVHTPSGIVGVTVREDGFVANGVSTAPVLSANGEWVAFESPATNLVGNDSNSRSDVFLAGVGSIDIHRVSETSIGAGGDGASSAADVSASGRHVVFESSAENLVPGDDNLADDIFLYDRIDDTLERLNLDSDGEQAEADSGTPTISGDGRVVAFISSDRLVPTDTNDFWDRYLRDRPSASTERLGDGGIVAWPGDLSDDGRFAIIGEDGILVLDRATGLTVRADVDPTGVPGSTIGGEPSMSADGRYVAFEYGFDDLVPDDDNDRIDIFVRDLGPPRAPTNHTPVADAGTDRVEQAVGPLARLILDASLSYDIDGDPLLYTWSGPFGSAEGASPTVELPPGLHEIELLVEDPSEDSDTDLLTIDVLADPDLLFADGFESGDVSAWSR